MTVEVPAELGRRPVAVVGGGTLGRRIALMFATRGGEVRLTDASPDQRAAAADFVREQLPAQVAATDGGDPGRLTVHEGLRECVDEAWIVVEAVPERLGLKREVFAEIDRWAAPGAVLASNSSSYPTSRFADVVSHPERLLNLHFYMPPRAVAVEVMSCGQTDPAYLQRMLDVLPAYGLVPFLVRAESTGFIYNRIWAAIKREALAVVEEGVAAPAEVDAIFRLTLGTQRGPFRMMDGVGLDVVLDIEEHYADERPYLPEGPRRLLRRYVDRGDLGGKTGRGFYDDAGEAPG